MFKLIPARDVTKDARQRLESDLSAFYSHPPKSYYELAGEAADHYNHIQQPFHCHLATQVSHGAKVLEVGCGTAHLCPHVEARGGCYHGVDYSEQLLEENRGKFPGATFWNMLSLPGGTYDLVASLYTIEHVTDPIQYLELLWRYAKPGGLVGIICPDFIDGEGIPTSIYYGITPGRIREKVKQGHFWDAFVHALEVGIVAPLWKRRARAMPPGAFWMNLHPRDLAGQEHTIDGDAVHFPRMLDIADWFEKRGADILATSKTLPDISPTVFRHNCYVLARKPATTTI